MDGQTGQSSMDGCLIYASAIRLQAGSYKIN